MSDLGNTEVTCECLRVDFNPLLCDIFFRHEEKIDLVCTVCLRPERNIKGHHGHRYSIQSLMHNLTIKVHTTTFNCAINALERFINYRLIQAALPEHHGTVLPVEGEIVDQDGAGTPVDGRWDPCYTAAWVDQSIDVQCHVKLAINTANPGMCNISLLCRVFTVTAFYIC